MSPMRSAIISIFLLFLSLTTNAQDKSVFVEIGGYAGFYSINYQTPFEIKDIPLKLRLGVSAFPLDKNSGTLILFPIGLNYEVRVI